MGGLEPGVGRHDGLRMLLGQLQDHFAQRDDLIEDFDELVSHGQSASRVMNISTGPAGQYPAADFIAVAFDQGRLDRRMHALVFRIQGKSLDSKRFDVPQACQQFCRVFPAKNFLLMHHDDVGHVVAHDPFKRRLLGLHFVDVLVSDEIRI